jgi:hypothetical protein
MHGTIPSLPNAPSGRGTQLKRAKGQLYLCLYHPEICSEDGKWKGLAQDLIQRRALILAVLKFRILLPES